METGTLMIFKLHRRDKKISMAQSCKLYRKLYGYNNSSCYGRYHTRVKGILERIGGVRLDNSSIIVKNEDAQQVVELLDEYGAEVIVRKVILTKEDRISLGLNS
ncbi:MAG TPA: hypothetical protein HA348_07960 [Thermoplasmata archaeon]|nr:hypothetical protein [Thermoplasmata archaeon]